MKTYFNAGLAERFRQKSKGKKVYLNSEDQKVLRNCIEHKLEDNKIYLLVPLSEIARVYEIPEKEFLSDWLIDVLLELQKKQGYKKIISIDDDNN